MKQIIFTVLLRNWPLISHIILSKKLIKTNYQNYALSYQIKFMFIVWSPAQGENKRYKNCVFLFL